MSEPASPPLHVEHRRRTLLARAASAILVTAALLAPPFAGAVVGAESPATVTLAPGLSVDAAVQHTGTSVVDFGAIGAVALPRVHADVPIIGAVSADLRVSPVTLDTNDPNTLSLYAALLRDPRIALGRPVQRSFRRRAEIGAALGVLLDAVVAVAYLGVHTALRRWRRQNASVRAALDVLDTDREADHLEAARAAASDDEVRHVARRLEVAALAGALVTVVVGTTVVAHEWSRSRHAPTSGGQPVDSSLVSLSPYLRDATITGSGAQLLVNKALAQVLADKNRIDADYSRIDANLEAAFAQLDQAGGLARLRDPRYVPMLDISDGHCALPYYEKVLPTLIHLTGSHLVIDTGDTDVSTGRLPFEDQCTDTLGKALQPTAAHPDRVDLVAVDGNHDGSITADRLRKVTAKDTDGKRYHPITVLDAKDAFAAIVDGVTFVGSPDPRQSVFGSAIQPSAPDEQHRVVDEQGAALADVACRVRAVTGVAPVLMTHDPSAADASVVRGCTAFATSGHTHHQAGPVTYATSTGVDAVVFTQGTSAGVGEDAFTLYATPKVPAPQTVFLYDTATHAIAGWYDIEIGTDLSVTVSPFTRPPAARPVPTSFYAELEEFTPGVLGRTPSPTPTATSSVSR